MRAAAARIRLSSTSAGQTEAIGREVAARLPAGVTVGLVGRLGAGKTCFVRGLASGIGIDPEEIASPTFVYLVDHARHQDPGPHQARDEPCPSHLYHADLYRLADTAEDHAARVFDSIGLYAAIEADALTAVEWWEHYRGPAPRRLVSVEFVAGKAEHRTVFFELRGPGLEPVERWLAAAGEPVSR